MGSFDLTALNPVLKELIDNQVVENMVYKDNPMFAMVKKNTNMGGKYFPQPIQIAVGAGRSANFANAQANQSASKFEEFLITTAKDYSFSTIDRQTMLSAKTDKQSFVNALENARDSALRKSKNSLGSAIFRSGTGSVGVIGTVGSVGTGIVQLASPLDVVQFGLNDALNATNGDGGTARADVAYVVAINKSKGQLTVSATQGGSAGTPASWVAGDYLVIQGDLNAKIKGLAGWLPMVDPVSGDNWFNVDRSVDRVALAGVYRDCSSQSIEEGLQDLLSDVDTLGDGSTDYVMTNKNSYTALIKSLGSKVQFVDLKASATIGFRGIQIEGPRGPVTVLSDRNCPAYTAYALQMDTWQFLSVGEMPALVEEDGLSLLRSTSSDSYEIRFAGYGNLSCSAPGRNGVGKLSA